MKLKFSLFERYKRYSKDFEEIVLNSLLLGHSTRKARIFFKKVLGEDSISHQFASSLLRKFDSEIEKWKKRRIDKEVACQRQVRFGGREIRRRVKDFFRFSNSLSCQRWLYTLITEGVIPKYRGPA